MTDLKTAYRPQTWDEVIGHDEQVIQLHNLVESNASHAYLLHGPSGTGKTTLARIVAREAGCADADRIDIDGATKTGIDDMREVTADAWALPLHGTARCVIIDECHRLSGNAWDSLLAIIEEPPKHLYWLFCTTRFDKVPATIRSRCAKVALKELSHDDLGRILDWVCGQERLSHLAPDISDLCIQEAWGSARALLGNLEAVRHATSYDEAARLLQTAEGSDEAVALARLLARNERPRWAEAMATLGAIEDHPEGVRLIVRRYMATAAARQKTEQAAAFFLNIMNAFAIPYIDADGKSALIESIGQVVVGGHR